MIPVRAGAAGKKMHVGPSDPPRPISPSDPTPRDAPRVLARGVARFATWFAAAGISALFALGLLTAVNDGVLKPRGLDLFFDRLFHLGVDSAVPTWWSSGILLAGAGASSLAWRLGRGGAGNAFWLVLAVTFTALSADEVAMMHETLAGRAAAALAGPTDGWLRYNWVIVGGPAAALFATFSVPFLLRLPRAVAANLVLAGGLFVGGAVFVEMFNARTHGEVGVMTLRYQLGTVVEELFEMTGAALFLVTVLRHVEDRHGPLTLSVGPAGPAG